MANNEQQESNDHHPYYDRHSPLEKMITLVLAGGVFLTCGTYAAYSKLKTMSKPTLQHENVIGGPEKDAYYEVDGQRAYVEIDGKPIGELQQFAYGR